MYPTSSLYKTAIESFIQEDKIEGTMFLKNNTVTSFNDSDIREGSLIIDNQCVNGEELEFGAVYSGQLKIDIMTEIDRYNLYDAEIVLSWKIKLSNGTWESIPLGRFYVTEAIRKGAYVSITALDGMIRFNKEYDGTSTYGSVYSLLLWVCNACGVSLGMTQEEVEALPNGDKTFTIDNSSGCSQYRDIVAIIAQITASFATMSRSDELVLKAFSSSEDKYITPEQIKEKEVADYTVEYMGLKCIQNSGTITSYDPDREDGLIMTINGNSLLDQGTAEAKQEIADNIRIKLCKYSYIPSTLAFIGDPAVECGDVIGFNDDGHYIKSIVTGYTWEYRGKHTLKSVGKNPKLLTVKNKEQKQYDNLSKAVATTSYSMIGYINSMDIHITPIYHQIARLGFLTQQFSSAVLMVTILVHCNFLEEEGPEITQTDVNFRIAVNGIYDDTFIPTQTIHGGNHIITFMYPLNLAKEAVNTVTIYAKANAGVVVADAGKIRVQVIGQGMASTTVPWDGTLMAEDSVTTINFARSHQFDLAEVTETVVALTIESKTGYGSDEVEDISFDIYNEFTMGNFNESVTTILNPV